MRRSQELTRLSSVPPVRCRQRDRLEHVLVLKKMARKVHGPEGISVAPSR
jgi:hypothetical protein